MTPLDRAAMTLALLHLRRTDRQALYTSMLAERVLQEHGGDESAVTALAVARAGAVDWKAAKAPPSARLLRARLALYLRAALREGVARPWAIDGGGPTWHLGSRAEAERLAVKWAPTPGDYTVRPVRPLWTQAPSHEASR